MTSVLLSLKKKPVIRYERSSPMAKKLGVEIQVSAMIQYRIHSTYALYTAQNTV